MRFTSRNTKAYIIGLMNKKLTTTCGSTYSEKRRYISNLKYVLEI